MQLTALAVGLIHPISTGRKSHQEALPRRDLDGLPASHRGWLGLQGWIPLWEGTAAPLPAPWFIGGCRKPVRAFWEAKYHHWVERVWFGISRPEDYQPGWDPSELWPSLPFGTNSTPLISCWRGSSGPTPAIPKYCRNFMRIWKHVYMASYHVTC